MANIPKTPSILPELQAFVKTLGPDLDYAKLLPTAAEAGYEYSLQQIAAEGCSDGTVLVTFQILVGREGKLEPFEVASVKVGSAPGPVSLAARLMIMPTLVYLFFGRLPPAAPAPQPVAEQHVDMSHANGAGDIVLPDATPADEEEDRDFPVPQPFVPEEPAKLELVARREPDGVPIFVDLYAMDGDLAGIDTAVIAAELVEVVETFIKRAETPEQLLALFSKNEDLTPFLKDFGTEAQRASIAAVSKRKHAQLSTPPVMTNQPKRRQPAARN